MTQDRPAIDELVAAVREFLENDVMPALDGRIAFHTRVAVNALGMVERELALAPELEQQERARAAQILGHDGSAPDLERELAARIRAGDFTLADAEVVDHVRMTVRDKLRIANPKYVGNAPSA